MKFTYSRAVRAAFAGLFLMLALFTFSSYKAQKAADEFWKVLGISQNAGMENIRNSFVHGYLQHYGARNIKNIAVSDRAAVATDLLNYTKNYINSEEFKKYYKQTRDRATPVAPEKKPLRSIEEIQKDEIARTEKSIRDTEKTIKQSGPDLAKSLQPLLDQLNKTLKEYQNPRHESFGYIAMGEKLQQEDADRRYSENLNRWNKEYPEDIRVFVASKLNKMLEATKDIDYSAALVEKYGKKRFVNANYERKSREWKQGFRAGKEVTENARSFVKKWAEELK